MIYINNHYLWEKPFIPTIEKRESKATGFQEIFEKELHKDETDAYTSNGREYLDRISSNKK